MIRMRMQKPSQYMRKWLKSWYPLQAWDIDICMLHHGHCESELELARKRSNCCRNPRYRVNSARIVITRLAHACLRGRPAAVRAAIGGGEQGVQKLLPLRQGPRGVRLQVLAGHRGE